MYSSSGNQVTTLSTYMIDGEKGESIDLGIRQSIRSRWEKEDERDCLSSFPNINNNSEVTEVCLLLRAGQPLLASAVKQK